MKTLNLIPLILIVACSKDQPNPTPTPSATQTVSAPTPTVSTLPPAPKAEKVELTIETVGNTMAFNLTKLEVPANSEVHLTLKNNSTHSLPHNWVLVNKGTVAEVAARGIAAGVKGDYLQEGDDDVLAFTPLAKSGETVEVSFTAPNHPGRSYEFFCSTPGHYLTMHGVFNIAQ